MTATDYGAASIVSFGCGALALAVGPQLIGTAYMFLAFLFALGFLYIDAREHLERRKRANQ